MSGPVTLCHSLNRAAITCISILVPRCQRAEWRQEWYAELWHVRQSCTSTAGASWTAEREIAAFCRGALKDATCLRSASATAQKPSISTQARGREQAPASIFLNSRLSGRTNTASIHTSPSASRCVLSLALAIMGGLVLALFLPGVPALFHPSPYRDARHLMVIQQAGPYPDTLASITPQQFRSWQRRHQELFDAFAYYQISRGSIASARHLTIAHASSNLLDLVAPTIAPASATTINLPRLILSDDLWKRSFHGDAQVLGQRVRIGAPGAGQEVIVDGIAPPDFWKLPGHVDAWLLEPAGQFTPNTLGFAVGHLKPSRDHNNMGERWVVSTTNPDGTPSNLLCSSLASRTRGPSGIFFFTVFLAFLALPATTSLPLGEYSVRSRPPSWPTRIRRWGYLAAKLLLLLPLVFVLSIDLAHLRPAVDPITADYIQILSSFSICLFGLRWILRDQRRRCPVCLGKLTHPARVGQPSRSFLAWNGTELICTGGHGLLHVPELPTSWFDTQRWLYLDPSWDVLFADPVLASANYF